MASLPLCQRWPKSSFQYFMDLFSFSRWENGFVYMWISLVCDRTVWTIISSLFLWFFLLCQHWSKNNFSILWILFSRWENAFIYVCVSLIYDCTPRLNNLNNYFTLISTSPFCANWSKSSFNILGIFLFSLKEILFVHGMDKFGVRLYRRCLKFLFYFMTFFNKQKKIYHLCNIWV